MYLYFTKMTIFPLPPTVHKGELIIHLKRFDELFKRIIYAIRALASRMYSQSHGSYKTQKASHMSGL